MPVMGPVAVSHSSKECRMYMALGLAASLVHGVVNTGLAQLVDELFCTPRMLTSNCLLFQLGKKRQDGTNALSSLQ